MSHRAPAVAAGHHALVSHAPQRLRPQRDDTSPPNPHSDRHPGLGDTRATHAVAHVHRTPDANRDDRPTIAITHALPERHTHAQDPDRDIAARV